MDIAIVTGANTRIGLAISRKLIETGCRVYGLAEDFTGLSFEHSDFIPVTCDLARTDHLCKVVQEITEREKDIFILVNHARVFGKKSFEEIELNELESLVHTNLLTPLILARLVLPSITRLSGYILNIGIPDFEGPRRLGSPYLSTEVALKSFSDRLFEELRRDKVKVCSLVLDMAGAEVLLKEGFTERDNHDLVLASEAVAQAVEFIVSQKRESVVSTLMVRPQKSEPNAKDREQVRKLPAPQPFLRNDSIRNVSIGRLKREEKPISTEKAPASYMDMAREVADEEALKSQSTETPTPAAHKKRRNRRRGNRHKPSSDQHPGRENSSKTAEPPERDTPAKSAESKVPAVKKQALRRKRPANPGSGDKSPNDKPPGPVTRNPGEQRPPDKTAVKKVASKRPVKKQGAKRPARKRAAPKTPET